ncbi:hypothetical protein Pcinc_021726 [Petrolisthes cinctipes]|uniref:Uncharacterized protein n=1 Tax=Petrolisthes cinctipes TaxID=88211 RepID=A0AAE1FF17_PETCI|nr:hypothetical protein Pcinc_021726 [Petrolisthes cinctipes]
MFIPELPGCYPEYDHTLYQYLAATTCLLPYTRLGIEVVMKTHQLGTSSLASLHLLQFRQLGESTSQGTANVLGH